MVMFTNWLMIGLIIKFHFRLKNNCLQVRVLLLLMHHRTCSKRTCASLRSAGYENSLPL